VHRRKKSTLGQSTERIVRITAITAGKGTGLASPLNIEEHDTIHQILIIENDLSLAHLEADVLTAYGYNVVSVPNGAHAISLLHQSLPDLVVLDLDLVGEIHGWDVLRELRTLGSTPVLITSSSTTVSHYVRTSGETRSTLDHLAKPYPVETLLKRVKRMLPTSPDQ
jgi:DNA-binding response OmpR family regulator